MSRTGWLFIFWLAATVALMAVNSACGGGKPDPEAPVPVSQPYWCVTVVQVNGDTSLFCTESELLCAAAEKKADEQAGTRADVLGIDDVGTCTRVQLGMRVLATD